MKMLGKRFLSIMLTVCLLLAALPVQALAETGNSNGNSEDTLTYTGAGYTLEGTVNEDTTVSITGITAPNGDTPIDVVIPDSIEEKPVTKIGCPSYLEPEKQFSAYHVTSVSIPASVTEITAQVFTGCQYLTAVTFAAGCEPTFTEEYFGSYSGVFEGCTALEAITLPAGTKALAQNMFYGCEALKSVNLQELTAITEIPDSAFAETALEAVVLPPKVVTVGSGAFYNCVSQPDEDGNTHASIQSVTLNDGLQEINGKAFAGCGITELTLPDSLTTLGDGLFNGGAFSDCDQLTTIHWPNNKDFTLVTGFAGCSSLPNTIFSTLPTSVTALGYEAFSNCGFTEVTLPNTITELGECALADNTGLASLALPDSLEKIGESAFSGCIGLFGKTVTIPEAVTSIGRTAFEYNVYRNEAVSLRFMNPDISLKDESGNFIDIFCPNNRNSTIYGHRYKTGTTEDSDVYGFSLYANEQIQAASRDDEYACTFIPLADIQTYTITGTVSPADATVTVNDAVVIPTNGSFSCDVTNDADVTVTVSKDGYISQTLIRAAGSTEDWVLGAVELAPLPVNKTLKVSLSDSEGKSLSGFDGLSLTLKTGDQTLAEGTDYTLQFPYIILGDSLSVSRDTALTLTAAVTDEALCRSGAEASTTLADPTLEMVLPAWGNVSIPLTSVFTGGHNVLLFDGAGTLAEYGVVDPTDTSYTSGKLKAGSYTAIIFNQNPFLSVLPNRAALNNSGLMTGDYATASFTVEDTKTTEVTTVSVPVLNTTKLGTIVDTQYSCIRLDESEPMTGVKFRTRIFYGFADSAVTGGTLTVDIPADAAIHYVGNEAGKLEENAVSNGYTKAGNTLTIPVSRNKGVVFMDLSISGTGNRYISASLSNGTSTSPLGSCAFNCYTTRLILPSEYFESRLSTITATIKAKPQTKVDVYMDGVKLGETTTDKLGIGYYDITPPQDAAIGQKLTIFTRTAEGDGASAVIKNYPTDAIVKEFFFTQYNHKYYVVQESRLTKNLSYNYRFVDYERDKCKDWSFSATINAKGPLDEELTSVTITMKTGDMMEVPLYLSGQTACEDGTTDYVFTGMVTLEHPGKGPNYFNNERVPVRLDLNYSSKLDPTAAGEYTSTQNRLSAVLDAAALTPEQEAEIEAQFPNPWTPQVIEELSTSFTTDYYDIYYGQFVADGSMTETEAMEKAKEDADAVLTGLTDEPDMDMLFNDAYVLDLELDEAFLAAEFTEAEQQQLHQFQSDLLNLQEAIESACGYLSAGLLLDKNLTDYTGGLEILEEVGITLSPEYAAKAETGTLADSGQIGEVTQEGYITYVYDTKGDLVYTIDTEKQWNKILAHKDAINSGNIESALPGAAAADTTGRAGAKAAVGLASEDDGSWVPLYLELNRQDMEAAVSFCGDYWLGLAGTGMEEKIGSQYAEKCLKPYLDRAKSHVAMYERYIAKYKAREISAAYMPEKMYDNFLARQKQAMRKISLYEDIPKKMTAMSKAIEIGGNAANVLQIGNDGIDIYEKTNQIRSWGDDAERHNTLYERYRDLDLKECESFPTQYDCFMAHKRSRDSAQELQKLNDKLRIYAGIDAAVAGISLAASLSGVGVGLGIAVATGGFAYGLVADKAKARIEEQITEQEMTFRLGEKQAKKYCKIDRDNCDDDDSSGSSSGGSGSGSGGNTHLGSGSIGSDLRECLDPSGIVYEAVESNPLSGVTAELWYSASQDGTGAVKWDAENYGGQINPQITDADGMYSWYVPDGYWQVKFTKDGYSTAKTAWLEVPPPRLDVNIGLISTVSPAVQSVNAYPDYVEIIFSQYMSVTESLTVPAGYTYEWVNKEKVNAESTTEYAKVLHLIPSSKAAVGDTVSVTVDGAKNYAGIALPGYSSGELTVNLRPARIVLNYEGEFSAHIGESPAPRVTARVLDTEGNPIPGLTMIPALSSDLFATVTAVNGTTDDNGIATFSIVGTLPGTSKLTLSVSGASLSTKLPVLITNTENRPERPTAKVGSTSLTAASPKENYVTVHSGQTMALSCATEGAVIYYTTDDTCPCQNTASRVKYTGPIKLTENAYYRIAAYVDGQDYSERLNINVTVTSGSTPGSPGLLPIIADAKHGSVTVTPQKPEAGESVTIAAAPDKGYAIRQISVTDENGKQMKLTYNENGTYSFIQPPSRVTIRVTFICDGKTSNCPSKAFADLNTSAWYHPHIDFVLENGLMEGYGNKKFGPDDALTRAQFAQILYNKDSKATVKKSSTFTDVVSGAWYNDAVAWAAESGVVEGYGDGKFGPDDPITREQLAVMFWRYAGRPKAEGTLDSFTDSGKASGYALDALRWAVEQGIIQGKGNGILDPAGRATRAEVAAMLQRFLEAAER